MKYRVYKNGNKRCTKVFDNLNEAITYVHVHEGSYYIEFQYENEADPRHIYF